ncbi:hypothetical protein [Sphingomonas japonica]|uniref:BON domain-containing protein n=2 Tax=Sphingomonas japonica TaxID=511662 RepID=A0ABX0TZJ1_9SPHN|nr:hypothetical protein [Sphingomonas japonica]NIJ23730.1 hypothetical protein [Sphingomonas japonica]
MQRGEQRAEAAAERLRMRVAQLLRDRLPGAAVTIERGGIAIEGRAIEARRDADPALRWIAGELR